MLRKIMFEPCHCFSKPAVPKIGIEQRNVHVSGFWLFLEFAKLGADRNGTPYDLASRKIPTRKPEPSS